MQLQKAINRLALAGEQVGISVEDMIQMLNSGVSVETLLDLICGLHAFKERQEPTSPSEIKDLLGIVDRSHGVTVRHPQACIRGCRTMTEE